MEKVAYGGQEGWRAKGQAFYNIASFRTSLSNSIIPFATMSFSLTKLYNLSTNYSFCSMLGLHAEI